MSTPQCDFACGWLRAGGISRFPGNSQFKRKHPPYFPALSDFQAAFVHTRSATSFQDPPTSFAYPACRTASHTLACLTAPRCEGRIWVQQLEVLYSELALSSPFLAQFKAEKSAFPQVCRIFCMVPAFSPMSREFTESLRFSENFCVRQVPTSDHNVKKAGMLIKVCHMACNAWETLHSAPKAPKLN